MGRKRICPGARHKRKPPGSNWPDGSASEGAPASTSSPGGGRRPRAQRADASRDGRRGARAAGFSLIEVLFAALLLVVAAGGLLRAIAQASAARQSAAHSGLAARVARATMEELLAAPFSRGWPWSGYHPALAPGGSVETGGAGVPGYVAYFDADGEPSDRREALYEVRWQIEELVPAGSDRLASLRLEVVALPAAGGRGRRGPVVRLQSVRVANRE